MAEQWTRRTTVAEVTTMREYLRKRRAYYRQLTLLRNTPPHLKPPAGWYPNTFGLGQWRWWDGAQWTGWTA